MLEKVRAKFRVNAVIPHEWGTEVSMHPVYSGSEENKAFWDATPNGSLNLTIKNEAAAKYFRPNAEYYIDFVEVPPEPAAMGG